jgi:hypothetical protein
MIYHEHLYYYSLVALMNHFSRYDMVVFDVKPVPIHGGSMRYYVCKRTSRYAKMVSPRVGLLHHDELASGFDRAETFVRFAAEGNERPAIKDRKSVKGRHDQSARGQSEVGIEEEGHRQLACSLLGP